MNADLTSGGGDAALYDPSIGKQGEDLEAAARAGTVLAMYGDGLVYRLFVDEELPEPLRAKISTTTKDVLLRVPSGKLIASPLEDVGIPAKAESSVHVPAGNYLVDVHELDYDWDRDIAPTLLAELPEYSRERWVKPTGGALTLLAIGCLVGGGFALSIPVLVAGAGLLAAGLGLARVLTGASYQAKKAAVAKQFPGLVLVLRRLDEGADLSAHAGKQLTFTD